MPHKAKKNYPTQGAALRAATRAALRTGLPMRVYPCGECHCFHITSEDRRKAKRGLAQQP